MDVSDLFRGQGPLVYYLFGGWLWAMAAWEWAIDGIEYLTQ